VTFNDSSDSLMTSALPLFYRSVNPILNQRTDSLTDRWSGHWLRNISTRNTQGRLTDVLLINEGLFGFQVCCKNLAFGEGLETVPAERLTSRWQSWDNLAIVRLL